METAEYRSLPTNKQKNLHKQKGGVKNEEIPHCTWYRSCSYRWSNLCQRRTICPQRLAKSTLEVDEQIDRPTGPNSIYREIGPIYLLVYILP